MAAFTGLHVTLHAGSNVPATHVQRPVIGEAIWSESMAAASTTRRPAPQRSGQMIFRVWATSQAWVSIGAAPDAVNGPKDIVTAGEPYDFECGPGDRLAWVLDA